MLFELPRVPASPDVARVIIDKSGHRKQDVVLLHHAQTMSLFMWGMTRGLAEVRHRALQIITASTAFEFWKQKRDTPSSKTFF
jgi:hypothetical protein